jgi:cyclopropane fatty-acyl-phospholipid synthase-like methyltransferase
MAGARLFKKPNHTSYDLAFLLKETEEEYSAKEDMSRYRDALNYQATSFIHLEAMTEYLSLDVGDVFVDLGCGKGRTVCFVALQGAIRKAVGVELRQELAEHARRKIREIRPSTPVEIHRQDAAEFESPEGTIYYMFNPFGASTVQQVIRNIEKSRTINPRQVRIVYNNYVHCDCLDRAGWLVREGQISDTDIAVWRSK